MGTDRLSMDKQVGKSDSFSETEDLNSLLQEYETLTDIQEEERQEILNRIDEIARKTQKLDTIDAKLEQFTSLLLDIRTQIAGSMKEGKDKHIVPKPNLPPKAEIVASTEEIQSLAQEVQHTSDTLDEEIASLTHLLEKKRTEIVEKDRTIDDLNDRLEMLTEEKGRLTAELENMNTIIDSWKAQLDLLQQLASSDPRYRVIEALKKHGSLSDIQLAFTMGTSINQLRKYIEDLLELKLIQKSSNGRYIWTGKEFDPDI